MPNRLLLDCKLAESFTLVRIGGLLIITCLTSQLKADVVLPSLTSNLVCYYDFDHPVAGDAAQEHDLGFSVTDIMLINGGSVMRTNDSAYAGSGLSLQTQQIDPVTNGNDDWKAGIYQTNGVASLSNFSAVVGITLMGWVKPTGTNPNLNTTTAATNDYYNAVGLFGLLSGTSEGHGVRALLEVIEMSGTLRLVALGRRIDTGNSLTLAATNDWQTLLPSNVWTHLAATFDFDTGTMALYRNGTPLVATYSSGSDPWNVVGGTEPDLTSASNPAGIKIGGSFPQDTLERNPLNGRLDDLMFFNRVLTASEVQQQYTNFFAASTNVPVLMGSLSGDQIVLSWPTQASDFALESETNLATGDWTPAGNTRATNGGFISVTLPVNDNPQEFFRLKKP